MSYFCCYTFQFSFNLYGSSLQFAQHGSYPPYNVEHQNTSTVQSVCTYLWLTYLEARPRLYIVLSESRLQDKPDKAGGKQHSTHLLFYKHELLQIVDMSERWLTFDFTFILNSVFASLWKKGIFVNAEHKVILLCCQSRGEKFSPSLPALEKCYLLDSWKSISLPLPRNLPLWQANQSNTALFDWLTDGMSFKGRAAEKCANSFVPPRFHMTSLSNISQKSFTHCHVG